MSPDKKARVNLKTVAERVGLAPCSISAVLNDTPASRTIPQATKDRIFRAAAELNYRPNFWARSLRTKRTRMVAVVTSDFGRPAVARVIAAVQQKLQAEGYLLVLSALNSTDVTTSLFFQQKGIEGLIAIDSVLPADMDMDVAPVDLTFLKTQESLGGLHSWLSELGYSAAADIVQKIERRHGAKPTSRDARVPSPYIFGTEHSAGATGTTLA